MVLIICCIIKLGLAEKHEYDLQMKNNHFNGATSKPSYSRATLDYFDNSKGKISNAIIEFIKFITNIAPPLHTEMCKDWVGNLFKHNSTAEHASIRTSQ